MSEINIKTLLDEGNTIVVCDANVYLHIYSFAQGYCDYAVTCLNTVKSYLIVPAMIEIEFSQHYRNCYKNMAKRLSNAEEQCLKPIEALRTAVLATCENLKKMQFPDIDELLFNLEEKIEPGRN